MNNALGTFPFGMPVKEVIQEDRSPKKVFVLGVYASAVHAKWISVNGKTLVKALAVASEPEIFWTGTGVKEIIENISMPANSGQLLPADVTMNGPSADALDNQILEPLGLSRSDAWLCDLVPFSCINQQQTKALERVKQGDEIKWLPIMESTVPALPKVLADENRIKEIYAELKESEVGTLIVLGDQPIRWLVKHFDNSWKKLDDFVEKGRGYGLLHPVKIDELDINILPLAHPRQIAKLGPSNKKWFDHHQQWIQNSRMPKL